MALSRREVAQFWTRIENYRNHTDFIPPGGYVILDPHQHQSHVVTILAQLGLDITSAAWVFEARRKSPPRWFKILGFAERGNWIELSVHLVDKSEQAQPPKGDLAASRIEGQTVKSIDSAHSKSRSRASRKPGKKKG